MKTQKDEYSVRFPIFTRSFDEYKSTLPLYLMIPVIKYFGLNEFSVRLPSAIMGSLSILLIYFLSREILKNTTASLITATVFATSPLLIHLSRVYQEGNTALFFLLSGIFLFIKSEKRNILLPASTASFMLSMYTYNSNKILSPIVFIVLYLLNKKSLAKYNNSAKFTSGIILVLSVSLFIYLTLIGQTFARLLPTNIFILWTGIDSSLKAFIFENPFYSFAWDVAGRYFAYFSPMNLFVRTPLEPMVVVPGTSVFEPMYLIFWLIGIISVFRNYRNNKLLIILILIAPLPAIVTWNWFQPGRVLFLVSLYCLIIALGIHRSISWLGNIYGKTGNILLYFIYACFAIFSTVYVYDAVNTQLPLRVSGNWQPGFSEVAPLVMSLESEYEKIVVDTNHTQPHIFYLFYGKYDPERYQNELDLDKIGVPRKSYDFGKFEFRDIEWETDKHMRNVLFVGDGFVIPKDLGVQAYFRKDILMEDKFTKNVIVGIK